MIRLLVCFAVLGGVYATIASGHQERAPARAAQAGTSMRFAYLEMAGEPERQIVNFGGIVIRARCSDSGDLRVTVSNFGPGQLQTASTDTEDRSATAFNERAEPFDGRQLSLLPANDDNQIGHTEVARPGGGVSILWQADNPGEFWQGPSPGTGTRYQCVFTGNVVRGGP
jgi:hypothetical protein